VARRGRVLAPDLPGHGATAFPESPPNESSLLEFYRDIVADMAEKLGLGRFALGGHSMGGAVALHVALAYPERLSGLVLVATSARLKVAPVLLAAIRHQFDSLPAMMASVGYSPATGRQRALSLATRQLQASQEVTLLDFEACAGFDLRQQVPGIKVPTTIISAADDLLTPPVLQQRLQQLIPRSALLTIPRSGHFLMLERADAVAEALLTAWPG
jgi:pimeloyl-ACP methyl ester carboxylesterase